MTVEEALVFFDFDASIKRVFNIMIDVGLSYIKLSQRLGTFSGSTLTLSFLFQ